MKEILSHPPADIADMPIIIYGGSFNPPTMAHVASIESLLEQYPDHQIWVMPSGERIDKPELGNDEQRMAMLGLTALERGWTRVHLTDVEFQLPRPSNTAQTVTFLQSKGVSEFRLATGVDSINSVLQWEQGAWLLDTLDWLIISRQGYELEVYPPSYEKVEIPLQHGLSSTIVRERIAQGESISGFVPETVEQFIAAHNLYKETKQ